MAARDRLLGQLEAAHHMGITVELLFQYTKIRFNETTGFEPLPCVDDAGVTRFRADELDRFNATLAGQWAKDGDARPAIPQAVLDHLRAEAQNACARCGNGIGVETAHIRAWNESRSHHHDNLVRICTRCHKEHDVHNSLPSATLRALKETLVERTRSRLAARMRESRSAYLLPVPAMDCCGRVKELDALAAVLREFRVVFLTGPGGIGKTQLLVRALHGDDARSRVVWLDVEQCRDTDGVRAALRSAVGRDGEACPADRVAQELDEMEACLVLDGVERIAADEFVKLEDAIAGWCGATQRAKIVVTSQVGLARPLNAQRFPVGSLDSASSRNLLEMASGTASERNSKSINQLLAFCDGHPLTLCLVAAAIRHYGSVSTAQRIIDRDGANSVALPGRSHQDRRSSLVMSLQTAYDALSPEARRLLWTLSECPAGVIELALDRTFAGVAEVEKAQAELRRWHLAESRAYLEDLQRVHVLSPIRTYSIERARREQREEYSSMLDALAMEHGAMVGAFEARAYDPYQAPWVFERYADELPNLVRLVDIATSLPVNEAFSLTTTHIAAALHRYYFVRGLNQEGANVIHRAAKLALDVGHIAQASVLAIQLISLAGRANNASQVDAGLALADQVSALTEEPELLADVAMAKAVAAQGRSDHENAALFAEAAVKHYNQALSQLPQDGNAPDAASAGAQSDCRSGLSTALGILGQSLLDRKRFEEAHAAYKTSLAYQDGGDIAVNRGQTLHQLGNCLVGLKRYSEAAANYFNAARIFHFVEMEEYLSNALSALGHTLIEIVPEGVEFLPGPDLIEMGSADLGRHIKRHMNPDAPLDSGAGLPLGRKILGLVILGSFSKNSGLVGDACVEWRRSCLQPLVDQLRAGQRHNQLFDLLMFDHILAIGECAAAVEASLLADGVVDEDAVNNLFGATCSLHRWVRRGNQLSAWLAVVLTHRWEVDGVTAENASDFFYNFDDEYDIPLTLTTAAGSFDIMPLGSMEE